MKERYNNLFNGELTYERVDRGTILISDDDYLFCEIDGWLCHEDGKERERAAYIVNATNNYATLYETLQNIVDEAKDYQARTGKEVGWVKGAENVLEKCEV